VGKWAEMDIQKLKPLILLGFQTFNSGQIHFQKWAESGQMTKFLTKIVRESHKIRKIFDQK
jgi:hypothetical protein